MLFICYSLPPSGIFNTFSLLSLTPSLMDAALNETIVRLPRSLPIIFTNTFLTVLGEKTRGQKWRTGRIRYRALPSLHLLA